MTINRRVTAILVILLPFLSMLSCQNSELNLTDLKLTDLNGKTVDFNNADNDDVYFVNFWATWCAPCLAEIPSIMAAQDSLKNSNYKFIFVSDENTDKLKGFLKKNPVKINVLRSSEKLSFYSINELPLTVIFNNKGERIVSLQGKHRWNTPGNIKMLKEFL